MDVGQGAASAICWATVHSKTASLMRATMSVGQSRDLAASDADRRDAAGLQRRVAQRILLGRMELHAVAFDGEDAGLATTANRQGEIEPELADLKLRPQDRAVDAQRRPRPVRTDHRQRRGEDRPIGASHQPRQHVAFNRAVA
jgi:hypothetical protein